MTEGWQPVAGTEPEARPNTGESREENLEGGWGGGIWIGGRESGMQRRGRLENETPESQLTSTGGSIGRLSESKCEGT